MMPQRRPSTLPAQVRALLSPSAFDHPAERIELVQTHISYVILAGDHAYKLRKPVDLGFLDFTSLEARRLDCLEEVRLNSRTCDSLYHGVVSLNREGRRYRFGGAGEAIDYAVHMRRLAPERMLSRLLETGAVDYDMIGRLVWKIARFHATADGGERVREIGGYPTMVRNWRANLDEVRPFLGRTISQQQFEAIRTHAESFLRAERSLLFRREDDGRVRDGHGDLRADAICFDATSPDGICIFDCLEFDERLRYSDTGLDCAFLAMDVERRGFQEWADMLQSLYTAAAADKTLPLVSAFFKCYRALIRGKVMSILVDQTEVPAAQRRAAEAEARLHFDLALSYTRPNLAPAVVLVMGLTGTGKSVLAGALAHRAGAALLSTDIVRKELARTPVGRGTPLAVGTGIYNPANTEEVYGAMAAQAAAFLDAGRAVIVDGTYLTRELRAPVIDLAGARGVPLLVVECEAPEDLVRARQAARSSQPWIASDATWEVYLDQKARYQPPDEVHRSDLVVVDTAAGLGPALDAVLKRLPRPK